jgi:hypothetical protein
MGRDLLRDRFGKRFITASDFSAYGQSLRIVESPFQDDLLQFLERERLLVPIWRMRYPAEVYRHFKGIVYPEWDDSTLPRETDEARLQAAFELYDRLQMWGVPHSKRWPWPQFHPFDLIDPACSEFVQTDVASKPFQPWDHFQVQVGVSDGEPIYDRSAVRTLYHYWQVFLLAEIMGMGVSTVADFGDSQLFRAAIEGRFEEIPRTRRWQVNHISCLRAVREFPRLQPSFEALAFFLAYRERALIDAVKEQPGPKWRLSGDALQAFEEMEGYIAQHAIWRWNQTSSSLLEFIKWECRRWGDWTDLDRGVLAEEWKRNIEESLRFYLAATGKDYDHVVAEVGRVTHHFRPTLEVLFPDWIKNQKEAAGRSLKKWIRPTMICLQPIGHDVSEAECDELLEWLVVQDLFDVLWFFSRLTELGHSEDLITTAGLRMEVVAFASSIEHLLNYLGDLRQATWPSKPGLMFKTKWLWEDVSDVVDALKAHHSLTQTQPDLPTQRTLIGQLESAGRYNEVTRTLLQTVLIRNQGAHLSFRGLSRDEVFQLVEVLLRSTALTWKHARTRGWV